MCLCAGYASASVDRQIVVEYFDLSAEWQAKKYVFKCHQQMVNGEDYVWPVNSLASHPVCVACVCVRQRLTLAQTQRVRVGGQGRDGVDLGNTMLSLKLAAHLERSLGLCTHSRKRI